jgi:hypothetical protein
MVRVCDLQEAFSDLLIEVSSSQARTAHLPVLTLQCTVSKSFEESTLIAQLCLITTVIKRHERHSYSF